MMTAITKLNRDNGRFTNQDPVGWSNGDRGNERPRLPGVMIVDDEPIVRLAFKSLVDWEDYGFIASYEAANGRQALEILDGHPEIDIGKDRPARVITEIDMMKGERASPGDQRGCSGNVHDFRLDRQ